MFLGLRMAQGVSKEGFFRAFGKEMDEVYPGILDKLISEGLLFSYHHPKTKERYVALTEYGLDVSNVVMAEFLLK